jgi:hypothetical protein
MAPKTRPGDDWGVGQMDDGAINSMTEAEARAKRAERDEEEAVWNREFGDGEDLDDVSDLDDDE